MNIVILDKSFNTIDIIDDFECLIWNAAYYKPGIFELKLPISRLGLVSDAAFVYRTDCAFDSFGGRRTSLFCSWV